MKIDTPFEFFWAACSEILDAIGQPDLDYNAAREAWRKHRTVEDDKPFIRAVATRKRGKGEQNRLAWRAEYRFIGGDWRAVSNDHGLTISYMSEDYALAAASYTRKTFIG